MAFKLSPEYLVAKLVKMATNGRVISPIFRRILTIILVPFWILLIRGIILSIINIKEEVDIYNRAPKMYPKEYFQHNLREPIELIIIFLTLIVLPWLIVRLIYWVIDADKARSPSQNDLPSEKNPPNSNNTFSKHFTPLQKLAVIRLAWLLGGLSEELLEKAQQPIQSIYNALDLPFIPGVLRSSRDIPSETACLFLLNHSEMEWILTSLYRVVMADGKQSMDKEELLSKYLSQLHVEWDEFQTVVKKANNFTNKFMS